MRDHAPAAPSTTPPDPTTDGSATLTPQASHAGPGKGRGTVRMHPLDAMTVTLAAEGLRVAEGLVRVLRGPEGERLRLPAPTRFGEVEHALTRARELLPFAAGRHEFRFRRGPHGPVAYLYAGASPGTRRRLARYLFDLGAFLASPDHVPAPDACAAGQLREAATRCLRTTRLDHAATRDRGAGTLPAVTP